MNFDIASSLRILTKGTLLGSSCLLFHGCTTWSPFKTSEKPEIAPESTLIESQDTKEQKISTSKKELDEERSTRIEKQHIRALPRRPVVEEESFELEIPSQDDTLDRQHSDEVVMYTVQKGDVLSKIARKFHTSVESIMDENRLNNKNRVFAGQILAIPSHSIGTQSIATQALDGECYIVQKGDTLSTIAKRFNTSIENLRRNNRLHNDVIYVGQKLRLATTHTEPSSRELSQIDTEKYVVQAGDVLWNIARRCGMSVKELMQINHISNPKNLRIGQTLYVKAQPEPTENLDKNLNVKDDEPAMSSTILDNLTQEDSLVTENDSDSIKEFEDSFSDLFEEESDIPVVSSDEIK